MESDEYEYIIQWYQQRLANAERDIATLSARLASAQKQGAQEPTGE